VRERARRAAWLSHAPLEVGKPAVLTPNLVKRRFSPTKGNAAWATNITDIRTRQGWLDLAVVIDLFSGKVVGWDAGPTIHHEHESLATPPTTNPEAPRLLSRRPPRCACAAGDRPLRFPPNPSSSVAIVIPIDVGGLPYRARSLTGEASL
jgi:hypothetical protein